MKLKTELKKIEACKPSIDWVGDRTLKQAWDECERADWLLWYATYKIDRKKIVRVAAMCAETVVHIYEERYSGDMRVRDCIKACYDYADNKINLDELIKYSDAAYAAYAAYAAAIAAASVDAAYAAASVNAAASAAYYDYAAYSAAYAAIDAAIAADADTAIAADADTADAADADTADKKKHHVKMCEIIRANITLDEFKK